MPECLCQAPTGADQRYRGCGDARWIGGLRMRSGWADKALGSSRVSIHCHEIALRVASDPLTATETNTRAFERYVDHCVVPRLRPGQLVILDNLSVHRQTP